MASTARQVATFQKVHRTMPSGAPACSCWIPASPQQQQQKEHSAVTMSTTMTAIASDDIVWEEPPSPPRRRSTALLSEDFLEALRARPTQWAVYGEYDNSRAAYTARNRVLAATQRHLGDSYQVVSRKVAEGLWRVYIRQGVGGSSADDVPTG